MKEGWICPRCGQVNAPWNPYCSCNKNNNTNNSNFGNGSHKHQWIETSKCTCGNYYKCKLCGQGRYIPVGSSWFEFLDV